MPRQLGGPARQFPETAREYPRREVSWLSGVITPCIPLADRRGVGIHGVQQNLHCSRTPALQMTRVVVRNYEARIQITVRNFPAHFVRVEISCSSLKNF